MSNYDERLSSFENTLATFQHRWATSEDTLNRNVTMLLGVASAQEMDIKEIKINLLFIRDRLNGVDQRLKNMDHRFEGMDQHLNRMDGRFESIDQRLNNMDKHFDNFEQSTKQDFGQVLQLLTTLTNKLE